MTQKILTDSQIDEIADRAYNEQMDIFTRRPPDINPTMPEILKGIDLIYTNEKKSPPSRILIHQSLEGMLRECKVSYGDGIGLRSISYLTYYKTGLECIEETDDEVNIMLAFSRLVYDMVAFENEVHLVGYPSYIKTDENDELHCLDGPAIEWPDQKEYFWHGTGIDGFIIEDSDKVTKDYLVSLSAEQRRATYECLGHEKVILILGLNPIDSKVINGLTYQLFSSDQESWLRMQSPPLQDGSQPYYVEPVHENCKTCEHALAWRATGDLSYTSVKYEIET